MLGGSADTVARKLFVPVTSTSPGSSASGTQALRSAATGTLGPYGSITLTPDQGNVVAEDTLHFSLSHVYPSSTSSRIRGFLGLNDPIPPVSIDPFVSGVPLGNSTVGTITTSAGFGLDYRAPQCEPSLNPVNIKVIAEAPGAATILRAILMIIPKRWYVDIKYELERTCADEPLYSYHVERGHELSSFELRDRQVANFTSGPFHERSNNPATWCPGVVRGSMCDQPRPTDVNNVQLTDMTGSLLGPNLLQPEFHLTVGADFPSAVVFEFDCHGANGVVHEKFSPPMGVTGHRSGTASFVFFPGATLTWELPRTPGLQITGESVKAELHPRPCP